MVLVLLRKEANYTNGSSQAGRLCHHHRKVVFLPDLLMADIPLGPELEAEGPAADRMIP